MAADGGSGDHSASSVQFDVDKKMNEFLAQSFAAAVKGETESKAAVAAAALLQKDLDATSAALADSHLQAVGLNQQLHLERAQA